jgi:hypothetical protein
MLIKIVIIIIIIIRKKIVTSTSAPFVEKPAGNILFTTVYHGVCGSV